MKRYHLIEIEDQEWCPVFLRDALTDYLQFTISLGKVYHPIIPILSKTIKQLNVNQVIDLCSGGSGPWKELKSELEKEIGEKIKVS